MFTQDERTPPRGPCAKIIAAIFGTLFLIALLAVPVTTTISKLRQDQGSNIVTRTTYPRKTTMFLPQVLTAGAHRNADRAVRIRSTQWIATMGIILALGILDYGVFCRLFRRTRRPDDEPGIR